MRTDELLIHKVLCALTLMVCVRTNLAGFLLVSTATFVALRALPQDDVAHVDVVDDREVSARVTSHDADEERTPNWRRSVVCKRTPAGQPTTCERNRLMRTLYEEMHPRTQENG